MIYKLPCQISRKNIGKILILLSIQCLMFFLGPHCIFLSILLVYHLLHTYIRGTFQARSEFSPCHIIIQIVYHNVFKLNSTNTFKIKCQQFSVVQSSRAQNALSQVRAYCLRKVNKKVLRFYVNQITQCIIQRHT